MGVGVGVAVSVAAVLLLRVGVGLSTSVALAEALSVPAAVAVALPILPAAVTETEAAGGALDSAEGEAALGEALSVPPPLPLVVALPLREDVAVGEGVAGAVDQALCVALTDPQVVMLGLEEASGERLAEAVVQGLAL